MNFETIDFRFIYPVTYMTARSRNPRKIYFESVEQLKIRSISRHDAKLALKVEAFRFSAKPKHWIVEQFHFDGALLGAVSNLTGHAGFGAPATMPYGQPFELSHVWSYAVDRLYSRTLFAEMLDTEKFWADRKAVVVDSLPLNADRIMEHGRDDLVQVIRDAAEQTIFIDGVFYAPKPAAVLFFGAHHIDYNGLQVWNGHSPERLDWPAFDIEHWEAAHQTWEAYARGCSGKHHTTEFKIHELDRTLAPAFAEIDHNARIVARCGLEELGGLIVRMPCAGVAALARFSEALDNKKLIPSDILADARGIIDKWQPDTTDESRPFDKEKVQRFRLCVEALASSQCRDMALVADDDADLVMLQVSG